MGLSKVKHRPRDCVKSTISMTVKIETRGVLLIYQQFAAIFTGSKRLQKVQQKCREQDDDANGRIKYSQYICSVIGKYLYFALQKNHFASNKTSKVYQLTVEQIRNINSVLPVRNNSSKKITASMKCAKGSKP